MNTVILFLLFSTVPTYSRKLIRTLTIDYVNISYCNPEYIISKIEMKKLDRRTFSMNISVDVFRDVTDMKGSIRIFKFSDNVYKETALKYSGDLCTLLDMLRQKYKIHMNEQFKHFFTKCPIMKGHYYMHNFNGKDLGVPIIPQWKTRTFIEVESNNVLIGKVYADITVIDE
ncbi:uncharacterized protein [Leptinotarsa decemlineata]|uniref:uncharacterized protein n=1 Tax=Leptinotarsa decemlineata TaxID=7539 RepID=UPI000C254E72|nr:uncharacterized protein LOC111517963 [Leptinotarsa decemlineata]